MPGKNKQGALYAAPLQFENLIFHTLITAGEVLPYPVIFFAKPPASGHRA